MKDASTGYRDAALPGATSAGLVVLLYEQAIRDLQRAVAAIEAGDIERRTREINHALSVIGHLQGTLDMQNGEQIAQNLARFYEHVTTNLMAAQIQASANIVRQQITDLLNLRESWIEVNRTLECEEQSAAEILQADTVASTSRRWMV
jgi:flagellar secretion chaperone FliS